MIYNQNKEAHSCRLCNSTKIDIIWDLGLNPLPNAYKNKEDLDKEEFQAPLVYFKCRDCHSVQLKYEIAPELLFSNYSYESPPNLTPHFSELAETTVRLFNLKEDDLVIDIGSSNGRLLQEYKKFCRVLGIEPAQNIAKKAWDNGIETINRFFDIELAKQLKDSGRIPKLIVCTNCFAHIPDIQGFIQAIKILLPEDGYFVFENAYLLQTLEHFDLGQYYFEHVFTHNLYPLKQFFNKNDLNLFHIEYNNVQQGTIRGYVKWEENLNLNNFNTVETGIENERAHCLFGLGRYQSFIKNINDKKDKLITKLKELKNNNKSISIYAWPAKMSVINKYFGLEPYIDYVIEESSLKTGKFPPGTKLEIKNLEYFKNNPTDICILGAYNFEKDIRAKNGWYNGEWINPLNV